MSALNAGVKSIEHGFMFDCEISALMKKTGAFITSNLTAFDPGLLDIPADKHDGQFFSERVHGLHILAFQCAQRLDLFTWQALKPCFSMSMLISFDPVNPGVGWAAMHTVKGFLHREIKVDLW